MPSSIQIWFAEGPNCRHKRIRSLLWVCVMLMEELGDVQYWGLCRAECSGFIRVQFYAIFLNHFKPVDNFSLRCAIFTLQRMLVIFYTYLLFLKDSQKKMCRASWQQQHLIYEKRFSCTVQQWDYIESNEFCLFILGFQVLCHKKSTLQHTLVIFYEKNKNKKYCELCSDTKFCN